MASHLRNSIFRHISNSSFLKSGRLYTTISRNNFVNISKCLQNHAPATAVCSRHLWNTIRAIPKQDRETFPEVEVVYKTDIENIIANRKGLIIDVRNPGEIIKCGRIGRAVHIPVSTLDSVFQMSNEDFRLLLGIEKPGEHDLIVLYCLAGIRAGRGCRILMDQGYKNIKRYAGSWVDWEKSN